MRLAVLSDIHANLEALQAVLQDAKAQGAEGCAGLGDFIGFNGDPSDCVRMVRPRLLVAVRGNHEQALQQKGFFGVPLYEDMIEKTAGMLSPKQKQWLSRLPLKATWHRCLWVHASPEAETPWRRLSSRRAVEEAFAVFQEPVCFFGHTHRAAIFCQSGDRIRPLERHPDAEGTCHFALEPRLRYLINPGSVGQPRDGDWRASYLLFDTEAGELTFRRVPYRADRAAAKIARTGLPEHFARALQEGSSPTGD